MPKLQNGPLRAAPINPGQKTAHGKVPSDLGHLAPLWCNWAWKCFAGGFLETSRKLTLGPQPAVGTSKMVACNMHTKLGGHARTMVGSVAWPQWFCQWATDGLLATQGGQGPASHRPSRVRPPMAVQWPSVSHQGGNKQTWGPGLSTMPPQTPNLHACGAM